MLSTDDLIDVLRLFQYLAFTMRDPICSFHLFKIRNNLNMCV